MEVQPLAPAPDAVAQLIRRLVEGWPEQGNDPEPLLDRLGFSVRTRDHSRPEVGEFTQLSAPLAQTTSLLLRPPDGDVGLSVFVSFSTGHIPQPRRGYRTVLDLLSERYGPPAEQWGSDQEPACCWHHDGRLVEMYTDNRAARSVQVDISTSGGDQA